MEDTSASGEISVEATSTKVKFMAGPALSRANRFEDWLWYESQADFEFQASQNVGCWNQGGSGRVCRLLLACLATCLTIFSYAMTSNHFRYFSYFTVWGVLFTNAALLSGAFVRDTTARGSLATSDSSRYGCRLWKVFTVLYQIAFLCESIIVPYYWLVLYKGQCYYDGQEIDGWPYFCWPSILDHAMPLTLLLLSQAVYAQPFARRHLVVILGVSLTYLIVNFAWTKLSGHPMYRTMDWASLMGVLTPLVILLFMPFIFLLLEFLNNLKLRATGHHQMIEISTGRSLRLKRKLREEQPVLDV